MAHVKDDRGNDKARVKFRFIEVEMEGGSHSLQENVRHMVAAIQRGGAPAPRPLLPRSVTGAPPPPPTGANSQGPEQRVWDFDQPTDPSEPIEADAEAPSEESKPKKERKGPSYNYLDDLDLTSGALSFRAFCEQKKPTSDADRSLVAAAWLNQHRQIPAIGGDHLKTCYRQMGWPLPDDLTSAMRNLKARRDMFKKAPEAGLYSLTTNGQKAVDEMGSGTTP